eukprot:COSAG04_NODE_4238_length_2213_cov_1.321665_2_plen_89_part_00
MAAENCILDYKMQQYRLFKAMGASYMMLWTGRNIAQFMADVRQVHAHQKASPKHTLSKAFWLCPVTILRLCLCSVCDRQDPLARIYDA